MDINQAVAEEMVGEGLLAEQELGRLAPPVYFLDETAHRKVGRTGALSRSLCLQQHT